VGEHTTAILRELGYSDHAIEELRAEQVVGIADHRP
jgi:crotonobetainyl-CoA:carnitine CoA-transferase CaiB-like acyl-CoA transferase